MQTLAITFFSIAVLLSAALMPNTMSVIPLLWLSTARAAAIVIALLFWVASGRVDRWGSSRLLLALTMILGTAAVTGGCLFVQMVRDDNVPAPMPIIYRATAALLPICFMAGALLPSRKMFGTASVLALVAGVLAVSTWKPLNAAYNAHRPKSKQQLESENLLARRMAELERVPASAGLEPLLGFVNPDDPFEVRRKAQDRIENTPDWVARVSAMLEGKDRLNALYVLSFRTASLPDAVMERCWSTAESVAGDQTKLLQEGTLPTESDERKLHDSVVAMGNHSAAERQRHRQEIAAVSDLLHAAKASTGPSPLDYWVRQSQLRRIPDDAGIVPLLEYASPGEAWDLKKEALARMAEVPDATAKLVKLLDGPHRLDALVVLAARVDGLSQDLLELCWRAAGLTAKEMATDIGQGKPPTRIDVRKLSSSVGSFWVKLGPNQEQRLVDLATVRDVVRAVGDDPERAAFAWADQALAPTVGPNSHQLRDQ